MQCSDLILGNLQPNTIQPSSLQSYTQCIGSVYFILNIYMMYIYNTCLYTSYTAAVHMQCIRRTCWQTSWRKKLTPNTIRPSSIQNISSVQVVYTLYQIYACWQTSCSKVTFTHVNFNLPFGIFGKLGAVTVEIFWFGNCLLAFILGTVHQ